MAKKSKALVLPDLPELPDGASQELKSIHNSLWCIRRCLENPLKGTKTVMRNAWERDLSKYYILLSQSKPIPSEYVPESPIEDPLRYALGDLNWDEEDVRPPALKRKSQIHNKNAP